MKRWPQILTRITILLLIVAAIWMGKDAILKNTIIAKAENVIGAKVEIGKVTTSLEDGSLF
ncbi:MAG: hypothetical protein AAGA30_18890, partial [Planctomycetota bacterium]